MHQIYQLSHAEAMKIVTTIEAEAAARQLPVCIAVVDSHGELRAFLRMDGCGLPPIQIAINKAYTAARERGESADLGRRSREEGFPMTNFGELRYVTWGGGVPLVYQGQVVGAVGVSGVPEASDIELARLGASTIG